MWYGTYHCTCTCRGTLSHPRDWGMCIFCIFLSIFSHIPYCCHIGKGVCVYHHSICRVCVCAYSAYLNTYFAYSAYLVIKDSKNGYRWWYINSWALSWVTKQWTKGLTINQGTCKMCWICKICKIISWCTKYATNMQINRQNMQINMWWICIIICKQYTKNAKYAR